MKKIFNWIWKSSADPKKVSMSVRYALLALIPATLKVIATACGFGLICLGVTAEGLNTFVDAIVDVVYALLLFISSLGFVYGFLRKIYNTVTGKSVR